MNLIKSLRIVTIPITIKSNLFNKYNPNPTNNNNTNNLCNSNNNAIKH